MEVVRTQPDVDVEPQPSELLGRLERQAAESGRLLARVEALEEALQTERDARRRLAATLKRERKAAEALHARAHRAEAAEAAQAEELARLREAAAVTAQQTQLIWMQLSEAERQLDWKSRPFWRRILRQPPSARAEHHLGAGEEGGVPALLLHPDLPHLRAPADVERTADRGEHVAGPPRGEDIRPQLSRCEVLARLEVAEGAPRRDGVREGHPYPTVHVSAGVEMAAVHLEASLDLVVLDPDDLDAEVAGEAVADPVAEQLRRDRRVRQAACSRSAPPS